MKLTGPSRGYRIVLLDPERTPCIRIVVSGVFPPEDAPHYREVAKEMIPLLDGPARKSMHEMIRVQTDLLLYGNATIVTPRGILNMSQQ